MGKVDEEVGRRAFQIHSRAMAPHFPRQEDSL